MIDANVNNISNTKRRVSVTLSKKEQEKLAGLVLGYGKMAAAMDATKCGREMIMRAKVGGALQPANAQKIRDFLNSQP